MLGKKGFLRSKSIWGNVGSIMAIIALIRENPEMIEQTRIAAMAIIAAVSNLLAIVGRWVAKSKIEGVFAADK